MIEGPCHVPMQMIRRNMTGGVRALPRSAVLHSGAANYRYCAGL
ncbi:hypothetical protein [Escherichia coli]